jgi:hypothetical protein
MFQGCVYTPLCGDPGLIGREPQDLRRTAQYRWHRALKEPQDLRRTAQYRWHRALDVPARVGGHMSSILVALACMYTKGTAPDMLSNRTIDSLSNVLEFAVRWKWRLLEDDGCWPWTSGLHQFELWIDLSQEGPIRCNCTASLARHTCPHLYDISGIQVDHPVCLAQALGASRTVGP